MASKTRRKLTRVCVEIGCNEPAGTPWTKHWCEKHDRERRECITKSLHGMLDKLEGRITRD